MIYFFDHVIVLCGLWLSYIVNILFPRKLYIPPSYETKLQVESVRRIMCNCVIKEKREENKKN